MKNGKWRAVVLWDDYELMLTSLNRSGKAGRRERPANSVEQATTIGFIAYSEQGVRGAKFFLRKVLIQRGVWTKCGCA